MDTILVTGGAGYVGSVLVPKLLTDGYHVKVLDLYLYGDVLGKHKRLLQIRGDIRDKKLVSKTLTGIDTVIHLACISNDPSFELNPKLGSSINYDATLRLIDASMRARIRRFIYASSSSVYGVKQEREVTEDLIAEPLTDYSKYKVLCEQYLLKRQRDDFTAVVLRPATVCGYAPRMRLDLTVNILTIHALVNRKITVHGGPQYRPNIHIGDMVDAYRLMLKLPKDKVAGKIYNVGYENRTITDLAMLVTKTLHDPSITIDTVPTDDLRSYRISSKKIHTELGFKPQKTIADAIGDLARAYRAGKIADPLRDKRYYNIQTMKTGKLH